jgi:zinc/manganese transport system substrate-binding protein
MQLRPTLWLSFAFAAALWLLPAAAEAKVKVVTTLPDLAAVSREVGGADVEVTSLAYSTQDPHFVDARPHLVLAVNKADLLVATGLGLEAGWLPTLMTGARNGRIQVGSPGYLDASTVVPLKQVPTQQVSRAMGDIHPGGNPHYMADPRNGARVGKAIAERLGQLDPAHRKGYQARAAAFATKCEAIAKTEAARFRALPANDRHVVVYHQSLVYLLDWLALDQMATLEPKPGIPPAPAHVASVLGTMRTRHVDVILQEEYFPTTAARLLAEKAKARLVVLPGGPDFEKNESYLSYVQALADKAYQGIKE